MVKTVDVVPPVGKIETKKTTLYTRFLVTLLLMLGLFVLASVITYTARLFSPITVNSYKACTGLKSSIIQETYPSVCVTKSGQRFVEPLSEEEQKLLESPLDQESPTGAQGQFCGGIMGRVCPGGFRCKYDGNYPDAGGTCIAN